MKGVYFTIEELQTLIWAIESKTASYTKQLLENGKSPDKNENVKRMNAISKKAYIALTEQLNEVGKEVK